MTSLDFRHDPELLAEIIDQMPAGVFTVDRDGRFVAWSQGAERITGYAASDIVGQPCQWLEGENCKGFSAVTELLASRQPTGEVCTQECKLLSREGRELYLHGNVRLLTNERDEVLGAIGTFTDVTSFVKANEKIELLQRRSGVDQAFQHLIGRSPVMKEVFRRIQLAADSDVNVLVTGESGTGKELAAKAIHALSRRHASPFLAVNCSAIPESLLESELFGHAKGAFTGADRDRLGLFEAADGGTLFLDEIGDISPAIQVKLLRVLQEREVQRVGEMRTRPVDVRLITATHRNLSQRVAEGKMREDFFYRIHVFEVRMPPLRERIDDIPLLVEHFLKEIGPSARHRVSGINRDALEALTKYHWPGNVRQLRNAIEHACVTVSGESLGYLDLPLEIRAPDYRNTPATFEGMTPSELEERTRIQEALRQTGGNRTKAAELLGYSRVTLWKKMSRLDIDA